MLKCLYLLRKNTFRIIYRGKYRSSAYETNEIDLLQRSIVPMNHFQPSILNLPIPKLKETMERYQASQEAILDETSFLSTKKCIESFMLNEGEDLHKDLLNFVKANKHTNYVNVLWTDMYLKDRRPVVLTHNPTIVFKNPKRDTSGSSQALRATNLIFSSIRFIRSLKACLLEPAWFHRDAEKTDTEKFRKFIRRIPSMISTYVAYFMKVYTLDMSQLKYLINTSRVPKLHKDEIVKYDNSNHILIIHKGQMYVFDILKDDGHGVDPKQIMSNILFILNQPTIDSYQRPGLGLLTTMNRDEWASARQLLVQLGNKEVLQKIDSAIFSISLDTCGYNNEKEMVDNTLHGSAENRWFDKSFSLIVDGKGDAAINFEHSWGDGIAIKRYFDEIYDDSELNPQFSKKLSSTEKSSLPQPNVNRLSFHLNAQITEEILPKAKKEYDDKRSLIDINFIRFEGFGEENLIGTKLGSDAMLQLSFQMAYYKLTNKSAASYESVTTSSFKDGRTETLRPSTLETRKFCELISKPSPSTTDLYGALVSCSKKHSKLTIEGLMGKGWDRHLFGLKYCAEQKGEIPELFKDPNYTNINKIIISTSTVPSEAIEMGAFAAVSHDGYGIGYGIKANECGAIVSTWKDSKYSNGLQFQQAMFESIKQISEIVELSKIKETVP